MQSLLTEPCSTSAISIVGRYLKRGRRAYRSLRPLFDASCAGKFAHVQKRARERRAAAGPFGLHLSDADCTRISLLASRACAKTYRVGNPKSENRLNVALRCCPKTNFQ